MKKIYQEIQTAISKSSKILLHLHPSPDMDSIGSSLAFVHYLRALGKDVTIFSGDSKVPQNLKFLPGTDLISERNVTSESLSDFDLFIILDSSSISQITKLSELSFPDKLITIVIDHHDSNPGYGKINLIDKSSPATSQIVFDYFKAIKFTPTMDMAQCLFVGIYGDTGGFKYNRTTWKTFAIATALTKIYPEFDRLIFNIENQDSPSRLKLIGLLYSKIENYLDGILTIAAVSYDDIKQNEIDLDALGSVDVANNLKGVVGWDIGCSMIETSPNIVKISLRTRDFNKYDLGQIAQLTGYGGGHKAAAGAQIPATISEAKNIIIQSVKKYLGL